MLVDWLKRAAYRWPLLRDFSRPRYPYLLQPPELVYLCNAIERTRADGGCIVEVGVARGMASTFLLQYMQTTFDKRPYYCVDTFSGFLDPHVEHEVSKRGKRRGHYGAFSWTHRETIERNIRKLGFTNCRVIQADAASFDWRSIGPVSVALIDTDIYLPTKGALVGIYECLAPGGTILVDDVEEHHMFDGAWQAFSEFCSLRQLSSSRLGTRGAAIIKAAP